MSAKQPSLVDVKAKLLDTGSISATERGLRGYTCPPEQIQDLVADAAMELIADAPREIRGSFQTICSWHRYNAMYQKAVKDGATGTMMHAQSALDAILKAVH